MSENRKVWIALTGEGFDEKGTSDIPIPVYQNELVSVLSDHCEAAAFNADEKAAVIDLDELSNSDTVESAILDGVSHRMMNQDEKILLNRKLHEVLAIVRMEGRERKRIRHLSIMQKFLTSFAKALMSEPNVIILNHSFSEVNSKSRTELVYRLRDLQKEIKIPVVYVTREDWEALRISDRILIAHDNIIEQAGSPEEIYYSPVTYYAANALDFNNIFEGYVKKLSDGAVEAVTECGTVKTSVNDFEENERVYIAVRPDKIHMAMTEPESVSLKGILESYHFVGGFYEAHVLLGDEQRVIVNTLEKSIPEGTEIYLEWKDDAAAWIHAKENGIFSKLENISDSLGNSLSDVMNLSRAAY